MRKVQVHVAACLAASLFLTGCVGKLHVGTTHALEPVALIGGAALTETLVIEADGAFGQGLTTSEQMPKLTGGWKVTDGSEGGTRRIVATRTFSGDRIYALPDEPEMRPYLGRTAIRITDLGLARRIEVRIGASPPFSTAGAGDDLTRGIAQLMLAGVTVDHSVQLPGLILGGNGTPAEGNRMVWHLDLAATEGKVLTAESLYVDWPRIGIVVLIAAALAYARSRRHDPNAPVLP